MVGTHIVEVDSRAELEAALDERVAMIAILGKEEHTGAVRLEEIAALAKPRGIPIMVDAASEHPTLPIPWLVRGADLVIYSGGKFMRGPQTSGLLLGAKNLVQAAARNSAPHHAFGRPMKVSKEDVIGVLAALEYWLTERDAASESHRWQDEIDTIAGLVGRLPDITCEVTPPTELTPVPLLMIRWNQDRYAIDGVSLRQAMLDGTPRIIFDDRWAAGNHVGVDPFNFQPGEAAAVGRALVAALTAAGRKTPTRPAAPAIDIAGDWDVRVTFLHGVRTHRVHLDQTGGVLTGTHSSEGFNGAVSGRVEGDQVHLQLAAFFEGVTIVYALEGAPSGAGLSGTAVFGCSNGENAGVANRSQYGEGSWTANRSA
jgi:seryl-tRNA(Sec) selenium transferase